MKKSFGRHASIKSGTNRIVSSTDCHWLKVTSGSLFKFNRDNDFLQVVSASKIRYTKDFTVKNRNILMVPINVFPDIMKNDSVEITYKTYKLDSITIMTSPGQDYKVGEVVYIDGGTLVPDDHASASILVESVGDSGEIIDYKILSEGKYLQVPQIQDADTSSNDVGHGAKFYVNFTEIGQRGWLQKAVYDIKYLPTQSIITLSQPLPDGVVSGKLSVEKWEIITKEPYNFAGKDAITEGYVISTDSLPHLGLSKLVRGALEPDIIINRNFTLLSEKIKALEAEIANLKK